MSVKGPGGKEFQRIEQSAHLIFRFAGKRFWALTRAAGNTVSDAIRLLRLIIMTIIVAEISVRLPAGSGFQVFRNIAAAAEMAVANGPSSAVQSRLWPPYSNVVGCKLGKCAHPDYPWFNEPFPKSLRKRLFARSPVLGSIRYRSSPIA
jgi:hypothetical protein